ncbi:MAG: DUF4349 domain-containing protein [Patescibacteria group bacterium]
MQKLDNKTFKIIVAAGLLFIAFALILILKPVTKTVTYDGNIVNPNMMDGDEGMYGYDVVTESAPGLERAGGSMTVSDSYMPSPIPSTGGKTAAEADQRIIKTADLSIGVDGVEAKTQEIITLATGKGGFVQSSTIIEDSEGYKSGYVTVRVPADTFEDTIAAIKNIAVRVDRESITGRDVTEQYTDTEARLRSAKAQEEQYLIILEKAETVQDILSVQSYLQSIRYEIESLQGQLDSLGNQTEYSTISVTLQEEVRIQIPTEKFDLVRDVKLALKYVVLLAQTAITYLVWFVVVGGAVIIPLGLLIGLVVLVVRKIVAHF